MTKKFGVLLAVASLLLLGLATTTPASAATKYKSCAVLQRAYPGGVAKSKKATNTKTVGGRKVTAPSKYRPKVSRSIYKANKHLDRDKDGIACER
ncbi:hypothetical protein GCM10010401_17080 [Rarobacter faecitabidus]|uniref:Excalibur calcium-binding domain-containing protein n=1 Tax=Rarobacter faecitabidus TaxID=13243 RepID=A0A542ZX17_RARFA|nr:excalibur calcium-binding domain-containing protein [Rarobacter faecitabidus]TQL64894.1 excalibur calcium-binding domain-containing protein [Rarobacter faecitabidus]